MKSIYGPRYHCKYFNSRAATILLCWNVLLCGIATTLCTMAVKDISLKMLALNFSNLDIGCILYLVISLILMLVPIASIAGDTIGRYRAIMCCLCLVWVGMIVLTLALSLENSYMQYVSFVFLLPCLVTYQANVIQFGVHQLEDHSSEELSSFIHWWLWSCSCGCVLVALTKFVIFQYVHEYEKSSDVIICLALTTFLSVLICIHVCWTFSWFDKELNLKVSPAYKSLYHVLRCRAKSRNFHLLSFRSNNINDDRMDRVSELSGLYSRHFTFEQVENAKVVVGLLILQLSIVICDIDYPLSKTFLANHLSSYTLKLNSDTEHYLIYILGWFSMGFILIPAYNLLICPILWRHLPNVLNRVKFGLLLRVLSVISCFMIDSIGHLLTKQHAICMFQEQQNGSALNFTNKITGNSMILLTPAFFDSIAFLLTVISLLEFIIAQTPYQLQGLQVGLHFSIMWGLPQAIGTGIMYLFRWYPSYASFSCGSAYYILETLPVLAGNFLYWKASSNYRYRQRQN